MAGIFDFIIDKIHGIDSAALLKAGAAGFKAATTPVGSNSTPNINEGIERMNVNQSFSAKTANGAPASVDSGALEAQWYSRLNKFANMQPVKPR